MRTFASLSSFAWLLAALGTTLVAPLAQAAEPDWSLPNVPEDAATRLECQSLIAVLPVVAHVLFEPAMLRARAGERLGNGELVELVRQVARTGDGQGLEALGLLFDSGNCFGGTRDPQRARVFYELAADRGNPSAARRLGRQ
ncbi:MAG: hypothetical protein RIQ60_884 [Pseudomonadota bacterium]|jgi:TPR repeat protein